MHTLPCARSAPKFSLHIAADFRPPVTPSVQIFTLRYENLFSRNVYNCKSKVFINL